MPDLNALHPLVVATALFVAMAIFWCLGYPHADDSDTAGRP